jgi:hypothetical protein
MHYSTTLQQNRRLHVRGGGGGGGVVQPIFLKNQEVAAYYLGAQFIVVHYRLHQVAKKSWYSLILFTDDRSR